MKELEAFRADAWTRLAERRPEAEKLYKQESEELKAALKQILWEFTTEGNSVAQELSVELSGLVLEIDELNVEVQADVDNAALKREDYMSQFLTTTADTFFDWVNQEQHFNGYIVLVNWFNFLRWNKLWISYDIIELYKPTSI